MRYDIDIARDVLAVEMTEWFEDGCQAHDYSHRRPPPWMWFVFDEAGIEVNQIADLVDDPDEGLAGSLRQAALEQITFANDEQINCYAKAREAWTELPWRAHPG